jgi:hypothetical protein
MALPMRVLRKDKASCQNAPHLSLARFELNDAVEPHREHAPWRFMPTSFLNARWNLDEADTRRRIGGRKSKCRLVGESGAAIIAISTSPKLDCPSGVGVDTQTPHRDLQKLNHPRA